MPEITKSEDASSLWYLLGWLVLVGCVLCIGACQQRQSPTASEIFDLRSKCQQLAEVIQMDNGKTYGDLTTPAPGRSHYNPKSNRCYVQIEHNLTGSMDVSLYDGQTKELLMGLTYSHGELFSGVIFMKEWHGLADSLGDPALKNASISATDVKANAAIVSALMNDLMRDDRTQ